MLASQSFGTPVTIRRALESEALLVRHLHLAHLWCLAEDDAFLSDAADPILDMIERGACMVAEQGGEILAAAGWERFGAGDSGRDLAAVRILFSQEGLARSKIVARLVAAVERDVAFLGLTAVECFPGTAPRPAVSEDAIRGLRALARRAAGATAAGGRLAAVA